MERSGAWALGKKPPSHIFRLRYPTIIQKLHSGFSVTSELNNLMIKRNKQENNREVRISGLEKRKKIVESLLM